MSYNRGFYIDPDIPPWLLFGLIFIVIAMIGGGIWLSAQPKTYIAHLSSKSADVSMYHDEQEISFDDGEISIDGSDETIANKEYVLTFYVDGKLVNVVAGRSRGWVGKVNADAEALEALKANDVEPPHWTYAKENVEYLVKTSWGNLEDLTPMSMVRVE
jgi:hypothetical protein